ncbi:MAG TPA: hypothetical protein VK364_00685, partial [Hymenobacter sp.]|nr:hypothetical protein [Hymenobacter sp.]
MKKTFSLFAMAALAAMPKLCAAPYVWVGPEGTGGSGEWDIPTNWSPNTSFPNSIADTATFGVGTTGVNTDTAAGVMLPGEERTVASITQTSDAAGYRIKGAFDSVLRVNSITNNRVTTADANNAPSNTTSFFSINYTPTLGSSAGGISAATVGGTLTLNSANISEIRDASNVLAGNIGVNNTTMGVTVQSGVWFFGGALNAAQGDSVSNTYTGTTTVSGGILILNKQGGATSIDGPVLINGGTLRAGRSGNVGASTTITVTSGTLAYGSDLSFASLNISSEGRLPFSNGLGLTLSGALTLANNNGVATGFAGYAIGQSGNPRTWSVNSLNLSNNAVIGAGGSAAGQTVSRTLRIGEGGLEFSGGTTTGISADPGAGMGGLISLGGNIAVTGDTTVATITSSTVAGAVASTLDLQDATRTFNIASGGTLRIANNNSAVNIVVANGGINKTGLGLLTLGGGTFDTVANTYAGLTTVSAGTLRLNKEADTAAVGGSLHVSLNGSLAGNGAVNGPTTISGSIRPGFNTGIEPAVSVGTLTVAN